MPYVAPTLAEFRARYAEFAPVGDALVQAVLVEAQASVSTSWVERDYAPAIMLLTAHLLLSEDAIQKAQGSVSYGDYAGPITKEKVGEVEVSYGGGATASSGASGGSDDYSSTEYGRRFLRLLRLTFAGPMVA